MTYTVEREVAEARDWYQVHHVVEGYKKMKKLLTHDMSMDRVYEVHYEQNVDSGYFRAEIVATRDLGKQHRVREIGSNVTLALDIAMWLRSGPTETENGKFGLVEFNPIAKLLVDLPGKRHKRTHQFFRRIWYSLMFREQFEYWVEFAEEELNRYINEVRNFYGLEPTIAKSHRLEFEPLVYGYT